METFCLIACFGVFFVIFGIGQSIIYDIKVRKYIKTEGTVVDYVAERIVYSDTNRRSYKLKINYVVNGVSYFVITKKGKMFEDTAKNCIGNKMIIYYSESNPEKAIVSKDSGAIVLIIIGLLFIIPAVILLLSLKYLY